MTRRYTATGDTERALTLLEQVAQDRPMVIQQLRFDPAFERLRSLPRFKRLKTGPGSVAG